MLRWLNVSTLKLTRRSFVLDMISKYLEIFLNSQLPKTRTLNLFKTTHHLRKLEQTTKENCDYYTKMILRLKIRISVLVYGILNFPGWLNSNLGIWQMIWNYWLWSFRIWIKNTLFWLDFFATSADKRNNSSANHAA